MSSRSEYGTNDDYSSSEQAEEETRGRKRPANVMKGADSNFLYAESKAARYIESGLNRFRPII